MKLKDFLNKMSKDEVYDYFLAICYINIEYDKITKNKMIEEIFNQFQSKGYIYDLCTKKELDFLEYIQNNSLKDFDKYEWEINELTKKLIFNGKEIYEDQKQNVKNALEFYHKYPNKNSDYLVMFVIGLVKTYANMITDLIISITNELFNLQDKTGSFLNHPLIHYYCSFYDERNNEFIYYRNYESFLDEIDDLRKEYGMAGNLDFNPKDYLDIFVYGFPIDNPKVKAMYDEINKIKNKEYIFESIDLARVFNNIDFVLTDYLNSKQIALIKDALLYMPCSIMNGFKPIDYKKEKKEESNLDKKFMSVRQTNAKISKSDADKFYKLYFALLEFVNNNYKINSKIKKIYQQEGLDVDNLIPIDDYLWENKEKIIDEFVNSNPYNFNKEELNIIENFKNSKTGMFIVVGYDKEYTMLLADNGILYMIKGINDNIDNILNPLTLPNVIMTTLLMFNGNIIYNSFFKENPIGFGNDFKKMILKDIEKAIKYYHL